MKKHNIGKFVIWGCVIVALIMTRCVYQDTKTKKAIQAQVTIADRQSVIPSDHPEGGVWRQVEAGTWSTWVPTLGKMISIAPGSAEVEYECLLADGKIVSKQGKPNGNLDWTEPVVSERFKSNVNLLYQSKDR
ncbi:MAG: hypothetical protein WC763_01380 [Candidatus Paceibacterota bacterium]